MCHNNPKIQLLLYLALQFGLGVALPQVSYGRGYKVLVFDGNNDHVRIDNAALPPSAFTVKSCSLAVDPSSLAFGKVVVGASATERVTVTNNGPEVVSVSIAISGPDANRFDVITPPFTLPSDAKQDLEVSFSPDSVRSFDASLDITCDGGIVSVLLSGAGIDVPPPPSLSAPTDRARLSTTEVTLAWSTVPSAGTYDLQLSTSSTFSPFLVNETGLSTTSFFYNQLANHTRYFWRVRAVNEVGPGCWSTAWEFVVYLTPLTLSVNRSFGDFTRTEQYRMVGLPGKGGLSAASTFEGKRDEAWRLIHDNGAEANYFVAATTFEAGRGYWAISRNPLQVQQSVSAVDLDGDYRYAIPLHAGWNIITNPYELPVSWSSVEAANGGSLDSIHTYNGGYSLSETLEPYTGYYFFNRGILSSLKIPYPPATAAASKESVAGSGEGAVLRLRARLASGSFAEALVRLHAEAEIGWDALDVVAPRGDFAVVRLWLFSKDGSARAQGLAVEARPSIGEGQRFELELGTLEGGLVTLEVEGLEAFAAYGVYLVDPAQGRLYDLKVASLRLVVGRAPMRLALLIGPNAFIEQQRSELVPEVFRMLPAYPNPFSEATHLVYALPSSSRVQVEIYDLLGRRVRRLVDGEQGAGWHEQHWDGTNDTGERVASGVYFYRVTAGGASEVRQVVVLR